MQSMYGSVSVFNSAYYTYITISTTTGHSDLFPFLITVIGFNFRSGEERRCYLVGLVNDTSE